jgi:hypothetical protein
MMIGEIYPHEGMPPYILIVTMISTINDIRGAYCVILLPHGGKSWCWGDELSKAIEPDVYE